MISLLFVCLSLKFEFSLTKITNFYLISLLYKKSQNYFIFYIFFYFHWFMIYLQNFEKKIIKHTKLHTLYKKQIGLPLQNIYCNDKFNLKKYKTN